jgi:Cu/Zn superoxide dismutase
MYRVTGMLAALSAIALCVPSALAGPPAVLVYKAELDTLNGSGVSGMVMLSIQGKQLTVDIQASGLEPGKPHAQHIHGFAKPKKPSSCPPGTADTNGDGLVDIGEGLPYYGPVILPLGPFDQVDADGNLNFSQTYQIKPNELQPLQFRAVVLHGLTVEDTYVPSMPVACGVIERVGPQR